MPEEVSECILKNGICILVTSNAGNGFEVSPSYGHIAYLVALGHKHSDPVDLQAWQAECLGA